MMDKIQITANTTLYPVPVVLITCGQGENANVFTLNRISSCNAEPPMLAISVRPGRASHNLIADLGEWVVNLPNPELKVVADFVGSTTIQETKKWEETGLERKTASIVKPPLLAICPVNIECKLIESTSLPSHTLFIGEVVAIHAEPSLLNERQEIDFSKVMGGFPYQNSVVLERPVENFKPQHLLSQVREFRDSQQLE